MPIIFHEASNLHDIIKSGYVHPGKIVNQESQSPSGPLDYVFFSVCNNDYIPLLAPYTIVFPSDVLKKYKWWTNTRHTMGPTAESDIYAKDTTNIDSILRKLYNYSLKQIRAAMPKYDPYNVRDKYFRLFAIYQEVFIKKSISLSHAIAVVIPPDFDITLLKKKYPTIKIILCK